MIFSDNYDIWDFDQLEFLAWQVVEGFIIGLYKSLFYGFLVEFVEYWFYNQGEDICNIDWKVYVCIDCLFIKWFEEEINLWC